MRHTGGSDKHVRHVPKPSSFLYTDYYFDCRHPNFNGGNAVGVDKLFGKSERIVVLAADHRYFGVVAGLEKPWQVLSPLLEHVDVLMTDPHVLRQEFKGRVGKPVLLRASG